MGFWAGFYKGWTEEGDRIEKRKLIQQELNDKRKEMAFKLAIMRKERGDADKSQNEAFQHSAAVLKQFGVSDDRIAKLSTEGGAQALSALSDAIQKTHDPLKSPLTPEIVNEMADSVVSTTVAGKKVYAEDILDEFGITVDPMEEQMLELSLSTPAQAKSTVAYLPKAPITQDQISEVKKLATVDLEAGLNAKVQEINSRIQSGEDAVALNEEHRTYTQAIESLKAGDPMTAVNLLGYNPMGVYLANNPSLAKATFGLGWDELVKSANSGEAAPVQEQVNYCSPGNLTAGCVHKGSGKKFLGGDPKDPMSWE